MNIEDKILGSLLTAAVGDAMGAITEHQSYRMLNNRYGFVEDILEPDERLIKVGHEKGRVTDDFSVGYYAIQEMIKEKSHITKDIAIKALLNWHSDIRYASQTGPTTRQKLEKLKNGEEEIENKEYFCQNSKVTNGAGMKAGVIGLFNPNNLDTTIDETITLCSITHDNTLSLSAACAISCAVSKALKDDCTIDEIIDAGIYGAKKGYQKSLGVYKDVAGCSIDKRIELAKEIAKKYNDNPIKAMEEIASTISCGLYAYESIPAVFGLIQAANGDPELAIYLAVNAGNDTDTVACMVGYIIGAYAGSGKFKDRYLNLINNANKIELEKTAIEIKGLIR